jgi:hypothetical protein
MRTLDVDWTLDERDGVSLVQIRVENRTETRRRIRVSNQMDGDLLPPRREGVPEAGWDEGGYSDTLAPGTSIALGYACLGDPVRPPVEVTDEGRGDGASDGPDPAADAVVRELGSAAPPASAVPVDALDVSHAADAPTVESSFETAVADPSRETASEADPDDATAVARDGDPVGRRDGPDADSSPDAAGEPATPDLTCDRDVGDWLAGVERRVERCERLTGATVPEAVDVLVEVGGVDGAETLSERVSADASALRALADRASRLADRAEETDVPVEALRRLA